MNSYRHQHQHKIEQTITCSHFSTFYPVSPEFYQEQHEKVIEGGHQSDYCDSPIRINYLAFVKIVTIWKRVSEQVVICTFIEYASCYYENSYHDIILAINRYYIIYFLFVCFLHN